MSDRGFEMVSASEPTDKFHRVRIRCSHDGCEAKLIFARRGVIEPVHAAKWFRDKGWFVSGHQRSDLCPAHKKTAAKKNGGADIKMKHTGIATPPLEIPSPTEPVMEEAPVTMTRTDKRIIHNKLDEVYVDEATGYRENWNDERVAADLGVAKEWVAIVREDGFGPEMSKGWQKAEVERLVAMLDSRLTLYKEEAREIANDIVDVYKTINNFSERIKQFEETAKATASLAAAYEEAVKEWKGKV